jgi:plasmid stability protein
VATLHVRNVPDELYEELRAAAEADGRSIGAEATHLLGRALRDRDEREERVRDVLSSASPFKARFAATAKELVLRAQALAQEAGAEEVAPPHVLLAMLEDPVLRPTLERGGITEESTRTALPPAAKPRTSPPPVGDDARKMLERALLAALDLDVP